MSPAAKKAVAAAAEKGSRYPFARVEVLRKAVAQYMGGKTDNILLMHGSAEAIRASIESFDVLPSLISGPPTLVKQDVKVSSPKALRERECALAVVAGRTK